MNDTPQAGPRYRFQSIDWWDAETHLRHTYGGLDYIPTAVLCALADQIGEELHVRELLRVEWARLGGASEIDRQLRAIRPVAQQSLRTLRVLQRARFVLTGELGTGAGFVPLVPGVDAEEDLTEPPRKPDTG